MKNVLIEIGTEELPASLINNLTDYVGERLNEILAASSVKKFSTPRRIAFLFENVVNKKGQREEIIYGPPWKVAFSKDGKPTKALSKFLEKNRASLNDVIRLENEKGVYACVKRIVNEKKPIDRVAEKLEDILRSVPSPKKMRWDDSGITFPRPIRWLLFICNDDVISSRVGNVISNKYTYGHRLLSNNICEIESAVKYETTLKRLNVIPSFEERRKIIEENLRTTAKKLGGEPVYTDELLNEVANLVEYPFIIEGGFDSRYLELPDLVIITVLAHHQRFFCVRGIDGNLLPNFIAVSNNGNGVNTIRRGYERVLKARLEDALFFFKEDLKRPLDHRIEELKGVLQHPKVGTLYDKVKRLEKLAIEIAEDIGLSAVEIEKLRRSVKLCKADIVTEMVKEFDELQGYMGYVYALKQGEDREVAKAIYDHYKPKSYGDDLPETDIGAILSIADKLDDIVNYFSIGEVPKGNSDPHGLRRAFIGILRIIFDRNWDIDLGKYVDITEELRDFARQRIINYFDNFPYDVVRAVIYVYNPLKPLDVKRAIEDLSTLREKEEFREIVEAYRRVSRIIPKDFSGGKIKEELLAEDIEKELLSKFKSVESAKRIMDLYPLIPIINRFFDEVLIMDSNESRRNNRLALLLEIKKLFMRFGDLDQIVSKEVVRNG